MKANTLKYGLLILILSLTTEWSNAQSLSRTAYFMENSTHRHLMNPALVPVRGYASLPVLGEFSLGFESNMKYTDFIYPALTTGGELRTFLHSTVDAEEFLSKLKPVNYFRMDMRTSLISLGFYRQTAFWTFDLATRTNLTLNMPYDMFAFAKLGMNNSKGNMYHLEGLSVGANMFAEASLGYSQNFMNNLRIGGKFKFLAGGANVRAKLNKMDIEMKPEAWTITTEGELKAYGKGLVLEKDEEQTINGVNMDSPGLGGTGLAIDLGVNYSPIRNLDLTLGIVDLGGIKWNKENIKTAISTGRVSYTGLKDIGTDSTSSNKIEDQLKDLGDDLMEMANFKEDKTMENFIQKLAPTINAGAEYSLLNNKISVGGLYTVRFMEEETYSELMGSINLRPTRWFNLSGSYSYMHGKMETVGFALGFAPGIINIFLSSDYVFMKVSPQFIPLNTLTSNFQLGVSVPLGRGTLPLKH